MQLHFLSMRITLRLFLPEKMLQMLNIHIRSSVVKFNVIERTSLLKPKWIYDNHAICISFMHKGKLYSCFN